MPPDLRAIFGQITITPQRPIKLSFERLKSWVLDGSPKGNRTPVSAVRGRHPRPLDDGAKWQPVKDSNPDELIQSQSCYRYTNRLHAENAREDYYNIGLYYCQNKFSPYSSVIENQSYTFINTLILQPCPPGMLVEKNRRARCNSSSIRFSASRAKV